MYLLIFLIIAFASTGSLFAAAIQTRQIMVQVRDRGRGVPGVRIRIKDDGTVSLPSDQNGRLTIRIPESYGPGTKVASELVNPKGFDWVPVDPSDEITVPTFDVGRADRYATIQVMRRGDLAILSNPQAIQNSIDRMLRRLRPSALENMLTRDQKGSLIANEARRLGVPAGRFARVIELGLREYNGPAEQARVRLLKGDFLQALPFSRKAFEEAGTRTIGAAISLALNEYNLGDYISAEQHYRMAVAARPTDLALMNDFGLTLMRVGKYGESRAMLEKVLAIAGEDAFNTRPAFLANLYLAWVLRLQAEFPAARVATDRAWAIAKRGRRPMNRDLADSFNAYGTLDVAEGNYGTAISHYMQALAIYNKLPDAGVLSVNLIMNIADARLQNGETETAAIGFGAAKKKLDALVKRRMIGQNHPAFAQLYNYLGGIYDRRHESKKATGEFDKAMEVLKNNGMTSHPSYADILNNRSNMYHRAGMFKEARNGLERVLAIRIQTVGADHPEVGRVYASLSTVYLALKQPLEALSFSNDAIRIVDGRSGFDQIQATAYNNRGGIYLAVGQIEKAEADFVKALDLQRPYKKQRPLDYSATLNNLVVLKRGTEAEDLGKEAVEIRKSIKGISPDGLIQVLLSYGLALLRNGKVGNAEEAWKEAVSLARQGSDTELRATSFNNLGELYRRVKRWKESEDLLTESLQIWHEGGLDGREGMLSTCRHYRDLFLDQGLTPKEVHGCTGAVIRAK